MKNKNSSVNAFMAKISTRHPSFRALVTDVRRQECTPDEFAGAVEYCETHAAFLNRSVYNVTEMSSRDFSNVMWKTLQSKENFLKSLDLDFDPVCSEVLKDIIIDLFGGKWDNYKLRFESAKLSDSQILSALVQIEPDLRKQIYDRLFEKDVELPVILERSPQISILLTRDLMSLPKVQDLAGLSEFGAQHKANDDRIPYLQNLCLDALRVYPKTATWLNSVDDLMRDTLLDDPSSRKRFTYILFSIIHNNSEVWDSIEDALDYGIKWYPDFGGRTFLDSSLGADNIPFDVISTVRGLSSDCGPNAWEDLRAFNGLKDLRVLSREFGYQALFGPASWDDLKAATESSTPLRGELSKSEKRHIGEFQKSLSRKMLYDRGLLAEDCQGLIMANPNKALDILGRLALKPVFWNEFTNPECPMNIVEFMDKDGLIKFKDGFSIPEVDLEPIVFSQKDEECGRELIHFDSVLFEHSSAVPAHIIQSLSDLYSAQTHMTGIQGEFGVREVLESLPSEVKVNSALSYFVGLMATATEQSQCVSDSPIAIYNPFELATFLTPTVGEVFPDSKDEVSNLVRDLNDILELSELLEVLSKSPLFNSTLTKAQYDSLDEMWGSETGLVSKEYMDNPIAFDTDERESLRTLLDCPVGLAYLDVLPEPPIIKVIQAAAYYEENPTDCLQNTVYDDWAKFKERLPIRIGALGSMSILCSESTHKGMPKSIVLNEDSVYDGVSYSGIYESIYAELPDSLPALEFQYKWFESQAWLNGKDRMAQFEKEIDEIVAPGYTPRELPGFLNVLSTMRPDLKTLFESASKMANSLFVDNSEISINMDELTRDLNTLRVKSKTSVEIAV
jgi:hypothetical protein